MRSVESVLLGLAMVGQFFLLVYVMANGERFKK
jgi:hypothetical protein